MARIVQPASQHIGNLDVTRGEEGSSPVIYICVRGGARLCLVIEEAKSVVSRVNALLSQIES